MNHTPHSIERPQEDIEKIYDNRSFKNVNDNLLHLSTIDWLMSTIYPPGWKVQTPEVKKKSVLRERARKAPSPNFDMLSRARSIRRNQRTKIIFSCLKKNTQQHRPKYFDFTSTGSANDWKFVLLCRCRLVHFFNHILMTEKKRTQENRTLKINLFKKWWR